MKRKVYFDLLEIQKLIAKLNTPAALYTSAFCAVASNEKYKRYIDTSENLDTLLDTENLNKLYAALNDNCDTEIEYRKNAIEIYSLEIRWIKCLYSEEHYCVAFLTPASGVASRNNFGELALIYTNLEKLQKLTLSAEHDIDKYPQNVNYDVVKNNYMKFRKISNDIELLTRFMNDVWPIKNEYYNCYTVICNIIEEYKSLKGNKKATFKLETNTVDASIYCDAHYMSEAFINVFLNILQFSQSVNTTLHVNIDSKLTYTQIDIYSNRLLLDEATVHKALYHRAVSEDSDEYLGLYIAYNIIARHNGNLAFSSDAANGTRVSIKLPADNFKKLTFKCDPEYDDFAYIHDMARTAFSLL